MWRLLLGGIVGFILSRLVSSRDQHAPSVAEGKLPAAMRRRPIPQASASKPPELSIAPVASDAPVSKAQLEQARSAVDRRMQNATGKRRQRRRPAA